MRLMSRARYAYRFLLIALAVAGCGQSGPLYMPGNPSQMTLPSTERGASAEESEAGDNGDSD